MLPPVDTRNPTAVLAACETCWRRLPVANDFTPMVRVLGIVQNAFRGNHPGFEPLDTPYHDLEHTLQGTLCLTRLFDGWHQSGTTPGLDARAVRLGTIAALLHDTGYLKDAGDKVGTGAKLTAIHVHRSTLFAALVLAPEGCPEADIRAVQSIIRCTSVDAHPREADFESRQLFLVGCALGTADLLGQMAAADYLEKLSLLHTEFVEAARQPSPTGSRATPPPGTPADLVRLTPGFWKDKVRPRLDGVYQGVHRFLNTPWPSGPNPYLEAIERTVTSIANSSAAPAAEPN